MFGIKRLRQEIQRLKEWQRYLSRDFSTHKVSVPASAHKGEEATNTAHISQQMGLQAGLGGSLGSHPAGPTSQQEYYDITARHRNACLFCGGQRERYSEQILFCPGCGLLWATDKFRQEYSTWKSAAEALKQFKEIRPSVPAPVGPKPNLFTKNGRVKK